MLRTARVVRGKFPRSAPQCRRLIATQDTIQRKEGDISSVFRSLSGGDDEALPSRFVDVKRGLLNDKDALRASWERLLSRLRDETEEIKALGSLSIPDIHFSDIEHAPADFDSALRKRGIAVIRQVVPENEARGYKRQAEEYIAANPSTKGTTHRHLCLGFSS